jgi:hypothetical protein
MYEHKTFIKIEITLFYKKIISKVSILNVFG